ncbi:dipeptide ABC transporter permease DppC [Caldalkalibacillus thermarum TA2.A1]|uniref:ABC transporter permease n=1 Tax=Caldalkalibacillus thermarum (strain TA2.A1) TaxID=986075 RepID=F5L606_CALTT|nr:dipeptide ABC transporter permease DppC [Caldalkalibacillus thermarum TA2.A1]QZT34822.1 ABC transporter permease [Caldalkalibacillus thermarum TA2.A1]
MEQSLQREPVNPPDHLFVPLEKDQQAAEMVVRPALNYWQDAWLRLKKNKLALSGLVIIIFLIVMAIFGPIISPYDYSDQNLSKANQPPSWEHWFGTDDLGRDVFTRTWYGARISLFIGILAALIDFVTGIIYGGDFRVSGRAD